MKQFTRRKICNCPMSRSWLPRISLNTDKRGLQRLFPFWHSRQVEWRDLDAMNHVNNATYFCFLESARIAHMTSMGLTDLNPHADLTPVLADTWCSYRRPALLNDRIDVGVRLLVYPLSVQCLSLPMSSLFISVNSWHPYLSHMPGYRYESRASMLSVANTPIGMRLSEPERRTPSQLYLRKAAQRS